MRTRLVLLAALAAAAAAVPQAGAAPVKPPQVHDLKGDANGVNAQGFEDTATMVPDGGTATDPASYGPADIQSVRWTSTIVKKKLTGYTISLTLGAAPAPGVVYRVESSSPLCAGLWAEYRIDYTGAGNGNLRCTDPATRYTIPPVKITGSTITWTIPLKVLGKGYKAGTILDGLGAQTRGFVWLLGQSVDVPTLGPTTGLTVPQLDHATGTAAWKLGS